jgi:PAS domain S-box-containing protein
VGRDGQGDARWRDQHLQSLSVAVWEFDGESRVFTEVSPLAQSMLGYPAKDWRRGGFWYSVLHPDDLEPVRKASAASQAAGKDHILEYRLVRQDGSIVWVREVVVVDPEHPVGGASRALVLDVTAQKESERARALEAVDAGSARDELASPATDEEVRYQRRLFRLAQSVLVSENVERRRLAVELHDRIAQNLAVARMRITEAHRAKNEEEMDFAHEGALTLLGAAIREIRNLTRDLSPLLLPDAGIVPALQDAVDDTRDRFGLECEFRCAGELPEIDNDRANFLVRTARELLVNVVKHARAGKATLTVEAKDGVVLLSVEDDGCGWTGSPEYGAVSGFGLLSIRERIEALGGTIRFLDGRSGRGALVEVFVAAQSAV